MQLNGSIGPMTIMAASEPPEPPPRNPDKINASLNKLASESKTTKSLDSADKSINNHKPFKPTLSEDNTIDSLTIASSHNTSPANGGSVDNNSENLALSNSKMLNSTDEMVNKMKEEKSENDDCTRNNSKICNVIRDDELLSTKVSSDNDNSPCSNSQNSQSDNMHQGELVQRDDTVNQTNFESNGNGNAEAKAENNQLERSVSLEFQNNHAESKLRQENERLSNEISRLKRLLDCSHIGAVGGIDRDSKNFEDDQLADGSGITRTERLELELKLAKDQISQLRNERKKLKADKMDLLAHVKQLCATLQDKEQELRDFIRNYEHRIRETETSNAKVSSDRERERWSLLKHARDESERSLSLAAQLNARDIQLQRIQEQLQEARRQLSGCMSDQESLLSFAPLTPPSGMVNQMAGPSSGFGSLTITERGGSCSADSGVRGSSDKDSTAGDFNLSDGPSENGPCIMVDSDSISLVSSNHNMYQFGTPKERSPTLSPLNSGAFSRSIDTGSLSRSVEHLGSPVETDVQSSILRGSNHPKTSGASTLSSRSRGGTWGSISRVFARTRHRNKSSQPDTVTSDFQWSTLTEEGYAEKLRLLREASSIPIDRWRASQVLAWLEVALGMPQYSSRCSENVKSGKVLLELNDSELESGLGLTHPMHRKKVRLAIEEHRRPELIRYPTIGQLGHTWVASEWLPDIGLPQYTESFLHSLVDARMLDTLSKKELEKFLNVTRKFHQASIVHGIHVLRILKYDRQGLAIRRSQCENLDADPIVWTNQRFIRWARSIDLAEYADNLKDSGVHGGLVVLEPSFSGETMATALGIPPSKNIIRRHLTTEFDALVVPARAQLGQGIRTGGSVVPITGPGGLQHHHSHTADRRASGSLRFTAWKGSQGSLSKTFRFHTKSRSDRQFASSTSPTPSYSSSENGIYATIGPPPAPTGPPPPPPGAPPSHRVSAPPMDTGSSLPRYAQHRRVKSISDIEVIAATPV